MKFLPVLLVTMLSFGCGGYNSNRGMQPATTPNISSLSPTSAAAGSGDFMLTVNGTGFAANSVIYWNSGAVATSYVSAQAVTATIPAADIATAGNASVFVRNPGTGIYAMGVDSNTVTFPITP